MYPRSKGITCAWAGLICTSATTAAYGHGANPAVASLDNPTGVWGNPPPARRQSYRAGYLRKAPDNTYTWDTSDVAPGSYYLWSEVKEPVEENTAPQIISFSPGVLTTAHPGDPVYPAVVLRTPDAPFRFADQSYTLRCKAFDPDGTSRVKLEVDTSSLGADF